MQSLLGLEHTPASQITALLDLADQFVSDADHRPHTPSHFRSALAGRSVGLLFFEPSTRTRVSFELAATRLGATPVLVGASGTSIVKGESVVDTARNLEAMGVDAFVVRHTERRIPMTLHDALSVPVINAGNGAGEHPTQGLLDLLTIRRTVGANAMQGLRVTIIGDVVHSRVARSDVFGLQKLGASVTVAGPRQLLPDNPADWSVGFATSRREALADAQIVIALRVQKERMHGVAIDPDTYARDWGIDAEVVETQMRPDAWVMHPGPVMRGMELSNDVVDGPRSLILRQAGLGVATRQAVLLTTLEQA